MRTLAVAIALLLGSALAAAPAHAALGDNHCITKHEMGKIRIFSHRHPNKHPGMTRLRTYEIIDYKGRKIWAVGGWRQGRTYLQCGHPSGWVEIDYALHLGERWHATAKKPHWAGA